MLIGITIRRILILKNIMSTNVYTNYYPSNTVYLEDSRIQPFNQTPFIVWTPTKTIKNRVYYIKRLARENQRLGKPSVTYDMWFKHLSRYHAKSSQEELEDLLYTYRGMTPFKY